MANPVQRLRYFDGEYLRSYDFTDEQSYHIAMRRLMNRRLHLHGIVYGLEMVMDQDSVLPGGPFFFSIAPGMAIDQTGREILVTAPYSLTNVLNQPGLTVSSYEVWLCYQESETGLPAAGYLDCNVQNQSTRWQEAFQVILKPLVGPSVVADCGGVRLGVVKLQPGVLGLEISNPVFRNGRTYVGIRAQRIIAPDEVDQKPDPFDITAQNTPVPDQPLPGYLDVQPGVFNHGNVIAKKNLVVGDDFALDPTVSSSLPATGNLKVTGDLILNGDFFGYSSAVGALVTLKQYIQSYTPKFVVGPPISIPFPAVSTLSPQPPASDTITSSPFAAFPSSSAPQVLLAITEMDWQDPASLASWSGFGPILVSVANPAVNQAGAGFNTLTVQWTAGPVVSVGANWLYPITNMTVNFVVIYLP